MAARAYIGTSGWNYPHWAKGTFYPERLKQSEWLRFYCQYFGTVEINNTFYHLPERSVFEHWHTATPKHFVFTVKVSRFLTHMKKLAAPEQHLARFLLHASALRDKLGVLLFQLPPFWKSNAERLETMLEYLYQQSIIPKVRAALEIRHESWHSEECFQVLRQYNVSLVLADQPGFTDEGPLTADFVFVRRHGPKALYASNYTDSHLRRDARRIHGWLAEGRDVHLYFNNDACGYAIRNALRLRELLQGKKPRHSFR